MVYTKYISCDGHMKFSYTNVEWTWIHDERRSDRLIR